MSQKLMTVEELIKLLSKENPKALIATSDYNGGDHVLFSPQCSSWSSGLNLNSTDIPVGDGGKFVDNKNCLKNDIVYIGYRP